MQCYQQRNSAHRKVAAVDAGQGFIVHVARRTPFTEAIMSSLGPLEGRSSWGGGVVRQ